MSHKNTWILLPVIVLSLIQVRPVRSEDGRNSGSFMETISKELDTNEQIKLQLSNFRSQLNQHPLIFPRL